MDLLPLMKERYSLRSYAPTPVEEEKLLKILEAARIAPTAKNQQPVRIHVLQKQEDLARIRSLTPCAFDAPLVLICCGMESVAACNRYDGESWSQMDTSIAMTHMVLEAQALGLGSCIVGWFDKQQVHEAFSLPEDERVWCLLPIGYPSKNASPSPRHGERKPMEDLAVWH